MVESLQQADARALLDEVLTGPLDPRVCDQIVTETRGNPLALLELVRGLTPAELAGGFGLSGRETLAGSIEESFRRRVEALPGQTRLLLVAADPTGDPVLVWRAAGRLGIGAEAATPAAEAGCWSSEPGFGFVIRYPRRPIGGRRLSSGRTCTALWRRPPTPASILIGARGTGRRPRPGQTSRSPQSSSSRLAGRRRAGNGCRCRVPRDPPATARPRTGRTRPPRHRLGTPPA